MPSCGCDKVAQGAFHPRIPIKSYRGSSIEWVRAIDSHIHTASQLKAIQVHAIRSFQFFYKCHCAIK